MYGPRSAIFTIAIYIALYFRILEKKPAAPEGWGMAYFVPAAGDDRRVLTTGILPCTSRRLALQQGEHGDERRLVST
jgi:hypothetical protein